jgi:hypothetical protein
MTNKTRIIAKAHRAFANLDELSWMIGQADLEVEERLEVALELDAPINAGLGCLWATGFGTVNAIDIRGTILENVIFTGRDMARLGLNGSTGDTAYADTLRREADRLESGLNQGAATIGETSDEPQSIYESLFVDIIQREALPSNAETVGVARYLLNHEVDLRRDPSIYIDDLPVVVEFVRAICSRFDKTLPYLNEFERSRGLKAMAFIRAQVSGFDVTEGGNHD